MSERPLLYLVCMELAICNDRERNTVLFIKLGSETFRVEEDLCRIITLLKCKSQQSFVLPSEGHPSTILALYEELIISSG
jgi:hypothetical protein